MNESVLILTDFSPEGIIDAQIIDRQQVDLEKLFKLSKDSKKPLTFVLNTPDCADIFRTIKRKTRIIKAAGGIVRNGDGHYLFIYRLGKWDLPKGKVDEGEKTKHAAVREVEEECGIRIDYLGHKLATTYHVYTIKGELVLKKSKWYAMGVNKTPKLIPQKEEDITDAIWLSKNKFAKVKDNTYRLIDEIIDKLH